MSRKHTQMWHRARALERRAGLRPGVDVLESRTLLNADLPLDIAPLPALDKATDLAPSLEDVSDAELFVIVDPAAGDPGAEPGLDTPLDPDFVDAELLAYSMMGGEGDFSGDGGEWTDETLWDTPEEIVDYLPLDGDGGTWDDGGIWDGGDNWDDGGWEAGESDDLGMGADPDGLWTDPGYDHGNDGSSSTDGGDDLFLGGGGGGDTGGGGDLESWDAGLTGSGGGSGSFPSRTTKPTSATPGSSSQSTVSQPDGKSSGPLGPATSSNSGTQGGPRTTSASPASTRSDEQDEPRFLVEHGSVPLMVAGPTTRIFGNGFTRSLPTRLPRIPSAPVDVTDGSVPRGGSTRFPIRTVALPDESSGLPLMVASGITVALSSASTTGDDLTSAAAASGTAIPVPVATPSRWDPALSSSGIESQPASRRRLVTAGVGVMAMFTAGYVLPDTTPLFHRVLDRKEGTGKVGGKPATA